ncbi:hypothetical protein CRI77_11420 [Mycolicibacterium duvalii]|uniref:Uncharacterized protein n=1 Tax=Mycolicibacterium duvalii TaxID=39688 RepID=A0A7I7JYW9_9MYCO|nr:hypothetical protein [Mycolicibacterium duvalii]MCV7370848.1 hypothetical protein [Mycolicibacterium duvalii]PEG41334.1 hypothetical protein CRI77_11420 [Mycolicibacterium duvalii]BBX17097.1 hypothetical protein MDUV_19570 [Mycolicibacterium duvalii]
MTGVLVGFLITLMVAAVAGVVVATALGFTTVAISVGVVSGAAVAARLC